MGEKMKMNGVDPRIRRTRQLLHQALRQLLAEKPFQAISVQDIADRATVNRATFYDHFEDKFSLVDSLIREEFQAHLEVVLLVTAPLTPANLHLLSVTVFEYLAQIDSRCSLADAQLASRFAMSVQQALYAFIVRWLSKVVSPGNRQHDKLEATATFISWALYGAGIQWGRGGFDLTAGVLANHVVELLTGGVLSAAPPAQQGLQQYGLRLIRS
jgi:AcrR family transcriptional regulator